MASGIACFGPRRRGNSKFFGFFLSLLIPNSTFPFQLDDYSADCDTTLKWVVKHGIHLAITCTKCNIMEHVDGFQLMQDHGLSCENKYAGDEDATADGNYLKLSKFGNSTFWNFEFFISEFTCLTYKI